MRIAPVGLLLGRDRREIFELAVECAAITHGHPSGYLAAGAMAVMVRELVAGQQLGEAARTAVAEILSYVGRDKSLPPQDRRFAQDDNPGRGGKTAPGSHEETVRAIEEALELAAQGEPSAEKVESLARVTPPSPGWVAEEALAVGLYCALAAPDMRSALRLAVTHSGDSDSTGSICGNLLGARDGERAIPADWLAE
jgi:ADP-ribosylglycohydrolase